MQNSEELRQEILGLEKKYWNAMRDKDLQTAMSLTYFPCVVAGPSGMYSVDEEQYRKMFATSQDSVRSFEFDEDNAQVHQVGPETAVIGYRVHTSFIKDGKSKIIDAVDTSTWVKHNNEWVCALHTETEVEANRDKLN